MEISDFNQVHLFRDIVKVMLFERGNDLLDSGTFATVLQMVQTVDFIEFRQDFKFSCIEDKAFREFVFGGERLCRFAYPIRKSGYGQYLHDITRKRVSN